MSISTYTNLIQVIRDRGAGFVVLIDPDKLPETALPAFTERCVESEVDAFFVGGSLTHATELNRYLQTLKSVTDIPIIGFPGSLSQLSPVLDAVLYLSVVSGRNPEYLIGQHVHAAPLIKKLELEPIPTGYMLVESGSATTAQYMSNTMPLPRQKPDVAAATALAAEMMGMQMLFTDGGSGADQCVPTAIIEAITSVTNIPLTVGGGISTPDEVAERVAAGAGLIVIGNAIEKRPDQAYITELAAAAHTHSEPESQPKFHTQMEVSP